ncbi:hypothetical protein D3C74_431880 [compost metagenome]
MSMYGKECCCTDTEIFTGERIYFGSDPTGVFSFLSDLLGLELCREIFYSPRGNLYHIKTD